MTFTMMNGSPTTELYFEAHITLAPIEDETLLREIAETYKFRVAELYMKNGERSKLDSFMSTRHFDYTTIVNRTVNCVQSLEYMGFEVWRYKIENTLLDKKLR